MAATYVRLYAEPEIVVEITPYGCVGVVVRIALEVTSCGILPVDTAAMVAAPVTGRMLSRFCWDEIGRLAEDTALVGA